MSAPLVLAACVFYFLLVLAVSHLTVKRPASAVDSFYRGDRKSPWYVVAIAMIGTSISGVTYVSVPGMVATAEMSYLQMVLGFVAGYFVVAYLLLPLYYRLHLSSIYVYLEQRYGRYAHHTGAAFFLVSKYLGCAVRMYLTALVLQLLLFQPLGVPFPWAVACIMAVVWLYSFRGGVKTLVWVDLLQTLCLLAAMVGFIYCMARTMGLTSLPSLVSHIAESPHARVFFFDDVNDTRFFCKQFFGGMFTTIAMTGLDQDMMQKNLSCRSLHEAQKNMVAYGFGFLPVNLVFLSLGILLYEFAAEVGVTATGDALFPTLATGVDPATGVSYLPAAVGLLFVLGLVAAAFSSAGSAVTALTTALMVDFLAPKTSAETQRKLRGRVHLANAVLMGLLICLFHAVATGSVIHAVYVVASYTYGPLLGLFFFGMFTRRAVSDSLAVSVVCLVSPLLCGLLDHYSATLFGGYQIGYELLVINGFITALGLALLSLFSSSKR